MRNQSGCVRSPGRLSDRLLSQRMNGVNAAQIHDSMYASAIGPDRLMAGVGAGHFDDADLLERRFELDL